MGGGRGGRGSAGRGPATGRGGRGWANSKKKAHQSLENKFSPYNNSNGKKYATFAMVEKKVILKVKKDLHYPDDISKSIINEQLITLTKPSLKLSQATDPKVAERENLELSIEYTEDLKEHKKQQKMFDANKGKVHAIIIEEFCTNSMVDKLREDPKFDTDLTDDFTKLLTKIKEIMYSSTDATNPYWSLGEAMSRFLNMKQAPNESLYEYKDRFRQEESTIKAKLGSDFLETFIKKTDKYVQEKDVKVQAEMVDGALDSFTAMCYVRGCNREKYQSLVDDLRSQYARGLDQYPTSVEKAMTLLSKHRPDNKKNNKDPKYQEPKKGKEEDKKGGEATSFMNDGKKKCFCCGSPDHVSPDCPVAKTKPKEEWVVPSKWTPKYAANLHDGDRSQFGFSGVHIASEAPKKNIALFGEQNEVTMDNDLKEALLLDSGSNRDIIGNKRFVSRIWDKREPIGVGTSNGAFRVDQDAAMINYGDVDFKEKVAANIVSLDNCTKKFRVQFDSKYANCFYVHTEDGILKFERTERGLYCFTPDQRIKECCRKTMNY